MKKILYIVGPTASGKTALALGLSKNIESTIISADSVQAYKELDVVSGKDIPPNTPYIEDHGFVSDSKFDTGYYLLQKTPLYMVDVVLPTTSFNISDFKKNALPVIENAWDLKRLPIVVGGTGFYIESLLGNIETINIPQNIPLRKKLDFSDVNSLQIELKKLSNERFDVMNESDRKNKRRLIRAIEVSVFKKSHEYIHDEILMADSFRIGLNVEKEALKKIIDKRVEKRMQNGALDEANELFKKYSKLAPQIKSANGYKQLFLYLEGTVSLDESILLWKKAEYFNAKKQMTWFRKWKNTIWFDALDKKMPDKVLSVVTKWYN